MIISTTIPGFFQTLALIFYLHPLHISVTEIEYSEKEKMLKIMMRVFADDLEQTMASKLKMPDLDLGSLPEGLTVDKIAKDYLNGHFRISLDGKLQKTVYLGHEQEAEAFIFYIEVTRIKPWTTILITNTIITETHDDQSNLVHVSVNDKIKSLRLTKDEPTDKLTFE